jgi:RsiW-degrading membrane proteinase PrsW (M82 family)/GNAT superfamily N-acetyltransferase
MSDNRYQPTPPELRTKPPRKWLGRKGGLVIAGVSAAIWFAIEIIAVVAEGAREAPTLGLVVGAFAVAAAFIYTMAYRLRPSDELSVVRLLLAFLVGGLGAAILAQPFDFLVNVLGGDGSSATPGLLSLSLAGVVEEPAKILFVILAAHGLARRNVRNGLFLGGAVGFGFAGYENMLYARNAWNSARDFPVHDAFASPVVLEIFTVVSRDIIGIFGHPLYTALFAAAVFASVRNGRFRLTWRVILAFVGVAFAHGLFDAGPRLLGARGGFEYLAELGIAVVEAVALSLLWRRISRRANRDAAIDVRLAGPGDIDFLSAMLLETANWDGRRAVTLEGMRQSPGIWLYLDGWQRSTDFGFILDDGGIPVGAAWARFFTASNPGYGYVDDAIPELSIAVVAARRHAGFGDELLQRLITAARDLGLAGLSLSVEDGNESARALYLKRGFRVVGRRGDSDTMLLRLAQ